jgi:DNA-directed RNA polymerase subunit RPC12/RpoP
MIKYFCSTCGKEVASLSTLVDLASKSSDDRNGYIAGLSFTQAHVCPECITEIKDFVRRLNRSNRKVASMTDLDTAAHVQ